MDTLDKILNAGLGAFNTFKGADVAEDQTRAQVRAAQANAQVAQANSAWTKYIPLFIGGAVLLAVVGWFASRK